MYMVNNYHFLRRQRYKKIMTKNCKKQNFVIRARWLGNEVDEAMKNEEWNCGESESDHQRFHVERDASNITDPERGQ